jgi:osmotically-inducible protein OsmY
MRFRSWIGALVVIGIAAAPAAAWAQVAPKSDEGTLTSRIETRLKANAALKDDDIKVDAADGVVTLTGTVDSQAQKATAARLARVAGVTRVENKLEVEAAAASKTEKTMDKAAAKTDRTMDKAAAKTDRTMDKAGDKAERAAEKTAQATKKAGEATKDAAGTAGSRTKDAAGNVGEAITDAWITTKIKTDFVGEDALKGSNINVDTNNHIVTLKGTVATEAGRARAMAIAKATKGVTRVVDALTIAPAK